MTNNSRYMSIYKKDYIRHKIRRDFTLTQCPSCKRLSIPKNIKQKLVKKI